MLFNQQLNSRMSVKTIWFILVLFFCTGSFGWAIDGEIPNPQWLNIHRQCWSIVRQVEIEVSSISYNQLDSMRSFGVREGEIFWKVLSASLETQIVGSPSTDRLLEETQIAVEEFFQPQMNDITARREIHQFDFDQSKYVQWDELSGELLIQDLLGEYFQQSDEIFIGPKPATQEYQLGVARFGLGCPQTAKLVQIPSSTPEGCYSQWAVFQQDTPSARFQFLSSPWCTGKLVRQVEEYPIWDGVLQPLWKKTVWLLPMLGTIDDPCGETPYWRCGLTYRYDPDGEILAIELKRVEMVQFNREFRNPQPLPFPFPGARVIDYRFNSDREYRFGQYP